MTAHGYTFTVVKLTVNTREQLRGINRLSIINPLATGNNGANLS